MLLGLALVLCGPRPGFAQFSAAGSAVAESAAESAVRAGEGGTAGRHNVYRAARTVRSGAPVPGDFHAAGSRVVIDAPVQGDALLAGGSIEVRAPVGGDLRLVAGKLTLAADVGGEAMLGGVEVLIERGARIRGEALIAARELDLQGGVGGALTVYAQQVVIGGAIQGHVKIVAEDIELLDTARVSGTLDYTSPNELRRAPGAVVTGKVSRFARDARAEPEPAAGNGVWGWIGVGLWTAGLFLFGLVLMRGLPGLTSRAANLMSTQGLRSLGWGLAVAFGVPLAAGVAMLTIIGMPLGASALALYPVLLAAGYLVGVWSVALRAREALGGSAAGRGAGAGWLAGSLVVLLVVGVVPFVGWMISLWVMLAGTGAFARSLWLLRPPPERGL